MVAQSRKHQIIEKLFSPWAELSFPSWSLHRSSPAGQVRAPPDAHWGLHATADQQNAASERSWFFIRPRRGVNFIGFADNIERSRATEREAKWKCKRKETAENAFTAAAWPSQNREAAFRLRAQNCHEVVHPSQDRQTEPVRGRNLRVQRSHSVVHPTRP